MRSGSKVGLTLALGASICLGIGACGGGDPADSTSNSVASQTAAKAAPPPTGEASAAFRTPGGDNSIQTFGEEADAEELAAAGAVLAGYLRARAADEWERECGYLAESVVAPLERLASRSARLEGKGCGVLLAALNGAAPASTRANTMTAGVASLRVEGARGFALYHGAKGTDYFMPMVKEAGEWKVGSPVPSEFP
jgi:hypothetical protein